MKEAVDLNALLLSLKEKNTIQLIENTKLHGELKLIAEAKELLVTNQQTKDALLDELKLQIRMSSEQVSKLIDQSNVLFDTTKSLETEKKELHSVNATFYRQIKELEQKHSDVSNRLKTEIELNIQKSKKIEDLNSTIKKLDDFYEKKNAMTVLYNKLKGKKVME